MTWYELSHSPVVSTADPLLTMPRSEAFPRRTYALRWLVNAVHGILSLLFFAALIGALSIFLTVREMELSTDWQVPARPINILVLAADGSEISNRGETGGASVRLHDLPGYVPATFLAIEDRRYHEHFGVDPIGLLAALVSNITVGHVERGGSTITQQLAKNLFLSPEQTLDRKLREAALAIHLERQFSKDEILEMYLNRVYFGAGAFGIEAASRTYFGKSASELGPVDAAVLAGLVKAPTNLNPLRNPEGAKQRARLVLQAAGLLTEMQATALANLNFPGRSERGMRAGGYIADWVETLVPSYVEAPAGDLVVQTTIDPVLQFAAEGLVLDAVTARGQSRSFSQGALISMTSDGVVRAMVGGIDYLESQYNRAITARRQPGSTFKAFVYLAALEKGYSASTIADDSQFEWNGWSPRNANRRYAGPVTLEYAFAHSINTVAGRLAIDVTPQRVVDTAMRLGFSGPLQAVASIALGTSEVSLLELTSAYAPFANGGIGVVPIVIQSIGTTDGQLLYERQDGGPGRVIDPDIAIAMDSLLKSSWRATSGRAPNVVGFPAAGKTGTSQQGRDALFVGYAGDVVTAVWLGNDNDSGTALSGGNVPLDIWSAFMVEALSNKDR